jgi:formylglycine-generating enzyme required for sulfatase activity
MSRPVRGAFRFAACVAVLAVGCGGRTTASAGTGTTGGSGANAAGTASGGSAGAASGSIDISSGSLISTGSVSGVSATGTVAVPVCPVCPPGAICVGGTCSCPSGWTACSGPSGFTACVTAQSSQTDPYNCGHCSFQCPKSAPTCQAGRCVSVPDASTEGGPSSCPCGTASCGPCVDEGGSATSPPSCRASGPGRTDCGANGESCCTSLDVPGGTFSRTNVPDDDGGAPDLGAPATVSSFQLDKYDVTVGRFRVFLDAYDMGWRPQAGSGKHVYLNGGQGLISDDSEAGAAYELGWQATDYVAPTSGTLACDAADTTWTQSPGSNENRPINCVSWWDAYAFCIWDGGFLPSEAERDYAAAGGSEQREYPWGSTGPGTSNEYAIYGCYYPNGSGICTDVTNIAPVGTAALGAGRWGQQDLVGELDTWNLDAATLSFLSPCVDCATLTGPSGQSLSGGSFGDPVEYLAPPIQGSFSAFPPDTRLGMIGFRCAGRHRSTTGIPRSETKRTFLA